MTALWTDPETGIEHDLDAVGRTCKWDDQYEKEIAEIDARFACPHERSHMAWVTIRNGRLQLRNQCDYCGELLGNPFRHEMAEPNTPMADTCKAERWDQGRQTEIHQAAMRLIERHKNWWRRYDEYLNTDDWRRKRELVFQRARGTCEGCRERPAQQVHHLTYTDVGNEFLWQLVAVCAPCHDRFHSSREAAEVPAA
jgi:5-methylcytosine-specific restriction endonuclease McrA